MTFATWYILGLCWGFMPDDDELTFRLCEAQFASKMRDIVPDNKLPDWPKFANKVANVRWPK